MPTKSYRNPPSPKLLEKIGATNLTLADAIAEVVANSFDAAPVDENLRVEVLVDAEGISVVDNGVGMTEDVLVEAVKLGVDMSDVVTRKRGAKGKFGLGMKTACASMGRWWAVYTRPQGSRSEYRVVFDLAEWERRPDSADAWTIEIEEVAVDGTGPLGNRPHGTAILVRKPRNKNPLTGAVLKKLGEAFKPHLEQGDVILVNGSPAAPHVYRFVPGTEIPINIAFGPSGEHRISGWVAIDEQTHNDGQYGFNIYRHDQLVQTWNQSWFAAHLMTSRIIGEVHMDFIDATFFKLGLQESELWRIASAEMTEFMKPVVRASRELSRQGNINVSASRSKIIDQMRAEFRLPPLGVAAGGSGDAGGRGGDIAGDGDSGGAADGPGTGAIGFDESGSRSGGLPKVKVEAEEVVLEDGTRLSISRIETSLSDDGLPFDYLYDGQDPVELQTIVSTTHPLFAASKDLEQLRQLAVADSILRYLVDRCGIESRRAVEVRNAWLLKALEGSQEVSR